MSKFNGYKLCGKRGGSPFVDSERPISSTNGTLQCNQGYLPCDPKGNPEFTVCYKQGELLANVCPITSIQFQGNDISKFTTSKNGTNLPIVTFKISESVPCLDPQQTSVVHTDSLYHLELARNQPVCSSVDKNFKPLNVSISLYDF
jgi:hypothetical protein